MQKKHRANTPTPHRSPCSFFSPGPRGWSTWLFAGILSLTFPLSAHQSTDPAPTGERILGLTSTHSIKRDGTVDVEVEFDLVSEGKSIKRGPCLNFLRVYRGLLGLVLDNNLEVTGVWRDGAPESFLADRNEFETSLFVGDKNRLLTPGKYRYRVQYSMQGDWKKAGNHFIGAFDMVGPFGGLPIEKAVANVKLPDGVSIERFSSSVTGIASPLPGYETTQVEDGLRVETKGVMQHDRSFFINAAWSADSFATRSQWIQILRQHPRLLLALFSGLVLLAALVFLVTRFFRKRSEIRDAP